VRIGILGAARIAPLALINPSLSVGRAGAENIVYAAHHYLCPGA
jgi:hypothetical protein